MTPRERPPEVVTAADATLRTVGKIKLWWDVVKNALVVIVIVFLIVLLLRYHARWKSGTARVESISCGEAATHKVCDKDGGNCQMFKSVSCKLHLNGFPQEFDTNFKDGSAPSEGAAVKVYYDPTDRSTALLAKDDMFDDVFFFLYQFLVGSFYVGPSFRFRNLSISGIFTILFFLLFSEFSCFLVVSLHVMVLSVAYLINLFTLDIIHSATYP